MGNEIWEQLNKVDYPPEVLERVNKYVSYLDYNIYNKDVVAEVSCGNKFIGDSLIHRSIIDDKKIDIDFYDFYPAFEDVMFLDLQDENTIIPRAKEYDVVYSSHVFEHLANPEIALSIIKDVFLKPDGRIFINVPVGEYDNLHKPFDESIGHVFAWTENKLRSILHSSGFEVMHLNRTDWLTRMETGHPEFTVQAKVRR